MPRNSSRLNLKEHGKSMMDHVRYGTFYPFIKIGLDPKKG